MPHCSDGKNMTHIPGVIDVDQFYLGMLPYLKYIYMVKYDYNDLEVLEYIFDLLPRNNCVILHASSIDKPEIVHFLAKISNLNLSLAHIESTHGGSLELLKELGVIYLDRYVDCTLSHKESCDINMVTLDYYRGIMPKVAKNVKIMKDCFFEIFGHRSAFAHDCEQINLEQLNLCICSYIRVIDLTDILMIPTLERLTISLSRNNRHNLEKIILEMPDEFRAEVVHDYCELSIRFLEKYQDQISSANKKYNETVRFKRTKAIMQ